VRLKAACSNNEPEYGVSVRVEDWSGPTGVEYGLLLGALGFEARASWAPLCLSHHALRRRAVAFDTRHLLSFDDNYVKYREAGFEIDEVSDDAFDAWCQAAIETRRGSRIAVDVSSFSRRRLAAIVSAVVRVRDTIDVDFVYSPAVYQPPPAESTPITVFGPVTGQFAGGLSANELPLFVAIGLGYEQDKAVGVLEHLEPADTWAFAATGLDQRYDLAVFRANRGVRRLIPRERLVRYPIDRPRELVLRLEGLTYGSGSSFRAILVPFGPKLFALACILVAVAHAPNVGVWRVSSGESGAPEDRRPSGQIVGLSVQFNPPVDPAGRSSQLAGQDGPEPSRDAR
jgi:hypothetical protein